VVIEVGGGRRAHRTVPHRSWGIDLVVHGSPRQKVGQIDV
jgi:hypothetical protein